MKGKHRSVCLCVPASCWGLLGPKKKKKKKKVNFLVLSSSLPLRNKPRAHSNPPPHLSPLISSILAASSGTSQHFWGALASLNLPRATSSSREKRCFVMCWQHIVGGGRMGDVVLSFRGGDWHSLLGSAACPPNTPLGRGGRQGGAAGWVAGATCQTKLLFSLQT